MPLPPNLSNYGVFYPLLLTLSILFTLPAYAAIDIEASRESAGAEQERFDKEQRLIEQAKQLKRQTEAAEEEAEDTTAEPAGRAFLLNGVEFSGNEKVSTAELLKIVQPWIGKSVRFSDLQKIVSKLKQYYRDKRFVAAYVYLPQQSIENGIVKIAVIEGKLGTLTIEGNHWYSEKVIERAMGLKEGNVVRFQDLNRGLSELNRKKDIKARAALKPGKDPKTTDIVLNIKDKFPIHLNADANNLGTENTGRTRWGVGLTHNNLTGNMDQLSTRFQMGTGALSVGNRYTLPFGPYRTQFGLSHSYSNVHLGGDFKDLNIRGRASTYGFDITQPFWSNNYFNTAVFTGFDFKSVKNKILGTKAGVDELRVLNIGLNLEETDRFGKTFFPQSVHIGFADFLGSSGKVEPAATRAGTGGQFFVYRNSLVRYNRLPKGITHTMRSEMQLTNDRLAPSEQFRLGGAFSVRGYAESDYLADYGAFVTNEVFIPSYFFPEDWQVPYSKEPLRQAIQGIAFIDFGGGVLRKSLPGERHEKFLAGAGGGVRIHLYDRLFARLQWAGRLGGKASDGNNSAFYYGISAET